MFVLALGGICAAQDFMLQGWYWDYPKTCNGYNWADTLKNKTGLLQGNFTYLWLPPFSRASFGNCSNGYDPKDLYDLGEFGGGATGFGTRADVDDLIAALSGAGISAVADVVYNHRDGGQPEDNPAVKSYITNHYTANKNPFPSDRYRCVLPLGGSSGNGAGDYFFKISSKTQDPKFFNKPYKFYAETDLVGWQGQADLPESEPNGGGDCGQDNNTITLGRNIAANLDAAGCRTDEFRITITPSDFNPAGDNLYIYLTNVNGDYSDHRIYGIWCQSCNSGAGSDIAGQLKYQTYTDFTNMPSNQGEANFESFKPNTSNAATTWLTGDWDWLWFFYDYDQSATSAQTLLTDWSKWLWSDVGIRGYRMDAVKHFDPAFVNTVMGGLASSGYNPQMVVGEFFDTDATTLRNWVNSVQGAAPTRVFDFSLRQALKNACDQFGYDVRGVFNAGVVDAAGGNGFNVVTFVNNHDYRDPGQPIQNDPMLAYAYILTNNQVGLPCIFYPEYFGKTVPNYPAANLRTQINELIQVHKDYIYQSNSRSYLSRNGSGYSWNYQSGAPETTLFYQLKNGIAGKDVLVCINFSGNPLNMNHTIDGSNFPVGTTFHKVAGSATATQNFTVEGSYWVNNIQVPARSYAVWAEESLLPVSLVDFQARPDGENVLLQWQSASESNFAGYDLERSTDGRRFDFLASVDSKGNGSAGASYHFVDERPARGQVFYYRLKMKDLDGSFSYSPVRSIRLEKEWEQPVFQPNPTSGTTLLRFAAPEDGNATLEVFDAVGRPVFQQKITFSKGNNSLPIPFENLLPGIYSVHLKAGEVVRWRARAVRM
jgi:alpha-amylase